jgi:hypothetical protein
VGVNRSVILYYFLVHLVVVDGPGLVSGQAVLKEKAREALRSSSVAAFSIRRTTVSKCCLSGVRLVSTAIDETLEASSCNCNPTRCLCTLVYVSSRVMIGV